MPNAFLYWDGSPPATVKSVAERWNNVGPDWNATLLNWEESYEFLKAYYGQDIANAFSNLEIPLMG